ncbi:MAG: UbiX family flavin prenyltransferase [Clostridiales bacterium]|jgi:4-hydroxy-3-polyprenylbenzoate decarboxylase|nr:UbiX family flavin prenyltransferase [Clostridiales bacterium]
MRLIVGMTGASGVMMAHCLLRALRQTPDCEAHLIATASARATWALESDEPFETLEALAHVVHDDGNMASPISSGSFVTSGMIILPCSMKSLAGIAHGYANNLLIRAADVCLKENRKVVLAPREMPFGKAHLQNMLRASELGCVIVPPVLTFYNNPQDLDDQIDHIVGKILMQFGIEYKAFQPWEGPRP